MNKKLRKVLMEYYMDEFGDTKEEAAEALEDETPGLATTELYDGQGKIHEMQVELETRKNTIVYSIDGDVVGTEKYDIASLIRLIEHMDFAAWYSATLEYAPEDYN